jgi:putative SbcD/Mre11-related phosphoesterase
MLQRSILPLTPYPALLFREGKERSLIVADLHIGWEISLAERGIHIPTQTLRLLERLREAVRKAKPTRLILLGDVKQAVPKITMEEWKAVPEFLEEAIKMVGEVLLVPGNHDGDIEPLTPTRVKLASSGGVILGKAVKVAVFHGHAWPFPQAFAADLLVMSHIHPVLRIRDGVGLWAVRQVWVKARCYGERLAKAYLKYLGVSAGKEPTKTFEKKTGLTPRSPQLIIMPAFNDLIGGFSIDRLGREASGPVVGSGAVDLLGAELYLLDGTFLGTVGQLSRVGGGD